METTEKLRRETLLELQNLARLVLKIVKIPPWRINTNVGTICQGKHKIICKYAELSLNKFIVIYILMTYHHVTL